MQFLLDNLSAQIIVGGMLLMLMGVNVQSQRAVNEVNGFYALRKQQLAFIDFLKKDMRNLTEVIDLNEDPYMRRFRFRARTETASNTAHVVTYQRVPVGEGRYRIDRYVDGQPAGGSMSTIVTWSIEARNAHGNPVTNAADASEIVVQFEAASPFGHAASAEHKRLSRWAGSFRPPLIQQTGNI